MHGQAPSLFQCTEDRQKGFPARGESGPGSCNRVGPSTTFDAAMKKPVLLLLAGSFASFGQNARFVFSSSAFGGSIRYLCWAPTTTTYLAVIDNPATNAITERCRGRNREYQERTSEQPHPVEQFGHYGKLCCALHRAGTTPRSLFPSTSPSRDPDPAGHDSLSSFWPHSITSLFLAPMGQYVVPADRSNT